MKQVIKELFLILIMVSLAAPYPAFANYDQYPDTFSTYEYYSNPTGGDDLIFSSRTAFLRAAGSIATNKIVDLSKRMADTMSQPFSTAAQTAFIMLVISAMAATKHEVERKKLEYDTVTVTDRAEIAARCAANVVNNLEFWASMGAYAGAGAARKVSSKSGLQKVMQPFFNGVGDLFKSALKKKFLIDLVKVGVIATIATVGWEASAQLWNQAIFFLKDPTLIKKAEEYLTLGTFAKIISGQEKSVEKTQLFSLVLANMGLVLYDSELRANWLYNTFRHRLATGEITMSLATIIFAATGGIAVGAKVSGIIAIPPVLKAIIMAVSGAIFATIAGAVVVYLPKKYMRKIGDFYKDVREAKNKHFLQEKQLTNYFYMAATHGPDERSEAHEALFSYTLNERRESRELLMAIYFEKLFILHNMKREAHMMLNLGNETRMKTRGFQNEIPTELINEHEETMKLYEEQLIQVREMTTQIYEEIKGFYLKEGELIGKVYYTSRDMYGTYPEGLHDNIYEEFNQTRVRLSKLQSMFSHFLLGLNPSLKVEQVVAIDPVFVTGGENSPEMKALKQASRTQLDVANYFKFEESILLGEESSQENQK